MDRVHVSHRGEIILATLGVLASLQLGSRSAQIERIFAVDGHGDELEGLMLSPDAALLATVGLHSATVWEVSTGHTLYRLPGGWHSHLTFSKDGTRLMTSVPPGVRIRDARTGALLHEHACAGVGVFSPAGDRVLILGEPAVVWTPDTGRVVELPTEKVWDGAWSPDGARVALASYENRVDVRDAGSGALVARLPHGDIVYQVRFTGDAILTTTNRHLHRWDAASFQEQLDIELPYYASHVAFAPDRAEAAVISMDSPGVRIFDLTTGQQTRTLVHHGAQTVAYEARGSRLVTAGDGVHVWDARSGALVRSFALTGEHARGALSADGTLLATTAYWQPTHLWDVATGGSVALLDGHSGAITSLALARDGRFFATSSARLGGHDLTAKLWERSTGRLLASIDHGSPVTRVAFAPDAELLATGDEQGTVRTWSTRSFQLVRTFEGHTRAISALEISSDGTTLLTASGDGTARLWRLRSGALEHVLGPSYPLLAAAFTPDGATVVTSGATGVATLWDATSGVERATLRVGTDCAVPRLAVDRRTLLTPCGGTLRTWDLPTGSLRHTLRVSGSVVLSETLSDDGEQILTTARDGLAKRWDRATGELRATLRGDDDDLDVAAAFVGTRVVTASRYTGRLTLWDGTAAVCTVESGQEDVAAVIADPVLREGFLTTGEDTAGTLRAWRISP